MASLFQLSGSLEEVPLPDIARLFQSTRKTGKLGLRSGSSSGAIFFSHGDIVDCQSMNMSGLDAVKHVALFNRGSFEFSDGATPSSETLASHQTTDLINILETRMQESRQLQELVPSPAEIPRYMGGAIPADLEMSAADLVVALRSSAGTHTVRQLSNELSLDELAVCYTIARLRAAGLMDIVGTGEVVEELHNHSTPPPSAHPPTNNNHAAPGSPNSGASTQPRYWRGRKVE